MENEFTWMFEDKLGRKIAISVDDDGDGRVTASHEGKEIGSIEVWKTMKEQNTVNFLMSTKISSGLASVGRC